MRLLFSVLVFLTGFLVLAPCAHAERRVALVIGNGAYVSVANLPNPPRDATAIGDLFKTAGFDDVTVRTDLGIAQMRAVLREFVRKAADADIAAVFHAGHGIEVGGHNYIIPVDAKLELETDVEDEAIDLDRVLQQLEPVKRLKLVILDACRECAVSVKAATSDAGSPRPPARAPTRWSPSPRRRRDGGRRGGSA